MKVSEFKPDPIKYSTEEEWAVFLIERKHLDIDRPSLEKANATENVLIMLNTFNSPFEAGDYVRNNHVNGNKYFIVQGWSMG